MMPMRKRIFSAFPREGLQFLRSLKRNNNREWFQKHRGNYEQYVKQPIADLIQALHHEFKKFAPEMVATPKASAYRIHRDIRFSKNKSPYKTHVAAVFPRNGLGKHEGAGFYVHIATDELLIGGGLYIPLPENLTAVRNHILHNPVRFLNIVESPAFRHKFGKIEGEQLTRIPRGFPADHRVAPYLKYKQFLASRNFPPERATTARFYETLLETFRAMLPLVRFLNEPIMRARRSRERQDGFLT
jgi:uncharacterized protein (TIGR02453 family)